MRLRRFEKVGASFTEDFSSLVDLRKRGFTVYSSPTEVSFRGKKGIQFDGVDDYMVVKNLNKPLNKGSVSVWVKWNDTSVNSQYCGVYDDGASSQRNFFGIKLGKIAASIGEVSEGTLNSDIEPVIGQTYHIVYTWEVGGSAKLYVNGVLKKTTSITQTPPNTPYFAFGGLYRTGTSNVRNYWFDGVVQDFVFFDFVLAAEDVQTLYEGKVFDYDKDLVSEWDMSEPYVKDAGWKGYENDGTPMGIDTSNLRNYGSRKGIYFDGSNDFIDLGTPETINFNDTSFSVISAFRDDNGSVNLRVIQRRGTGGSGAQKGWQIARASSHVTWANSVIDNASDFMNGQTLSYNNNNMLNNVALIFNNSNKQGYMYADGWSEMGYSPITDGSDFRTERHLAFGCAWDNASAQSQFLDGVIYKTKIFNEVVSQLGIKELIKNQARGL